MRHVLVALMLLCASACKPEVGLIVWGIGDSTMVLDLEQLHFGLANDSGDLLIPVAAIPCATLARDMAYWTTRARSAQERGIPADAVVVSLGTNDLGDDNPPLLGWSLIDTDEELDVALDSFLGAMPEVRVLWIVPSSPGTILERREHFARGLERAQGRWPRLELLTPDPAWFEGGDGIHYSAVGEGSLAAAIVARLAG